MDKVLKVIHVDTKPLDDVKVSERTLYDMYELAKQSFNKILNNMNSKDSSKGGLVASEEQAATLYSLHKQFVEGDADEFNKNKEVTAKYKYAVWLQQAGKNEE